MASILRHPARVGKFIVYRKNAKAADWIRKFVIRDFSTREFTESTSGWPKVPVLKK